VDIVYLQSDLHPAWAVEVKWSDEFARNPHKLKGLLRFCGQHPDCTAAVTTRTKTGEVTVGGVRIKLEPASLYCFILGYNIIRSRKAAQTEPSA
jgi:hypothetical protein